MPQKEPDPSQPVAGDLSSLPATSLKPTDASLSASALQTPTEWEFFDSPPSPPDDDELFDALELVHDEESFRQFLLALRDDRERSIAMEKESPSSGYGPDAGGWENTTIERFFDAAATWAKVSVNGTASYTKSDNPWRRCADILWVGKIYE